MSARSETELINDTVAMAEDLPLVHMTHLAQELREQGQDGLAAEILAQISRKEDRNPQPEPHRFVA